jgi:hypothetical protein
VKPLPYRQNCFHWGPSRSEDHLKRRKWWGPLLPSLLTRFGGASL